MSTLNVIETYIDKESNYYGSFLIEPLSIGQGITVGNALRRTLLSDLTGFAITGVRINNLKHEFNSIQGLREDVLELLLNLKEINLKSSFQATKKVDNLEFKGYLKVKGPLVVTAGLFNLPKQVLKIVNPQQYICTILDDSELYLEIDIERGKGYKLSDDNRKTKIIKKLAGPKPSTLNIDSIFMPIKKVNYKVKLIHDSKGNIKESLNIEIITNGTITPKRAIQEALKVLMNLFYPLLVNQTFKTISSQLTRKFYKKENTKT
jgi:DNA-directed RNA polymerase subunit alpha